MSSTSTRLGIQVPDGTDQANIPGNLSTIVNALDGGDATTATSSGTAWYSQGPTDPGHKNGGHLWWCTDTASANYGLNYYQYTGPSASTNGWRNIGPDVVVATSTPTGITLSDKIIWANPDTGLVSIYNASTSAWLPLTSVDWRTAPASNGLVPTVSTAGAVTWKALSPTGGSVGASSGLNATTSMSGNTEVTAIPTVTVTGATAYRFDIHGTITTASADAGPTILFASIKQTSPVVTNAYFPSSATALTSSTGSSTFQTVYGIGVAQARGAVHGTIVVTGLTASTTYTFQPVLKVNVTAAVTATNLSCIATPVSLATFA